MLSNSLKPPSYPGKASAQPGIENNVAQKSEKYQEGQKPGSEGHTQRSPRDWNFVMPFETHCNHFLNLTTLFSWLNLTEVTLTLQDLHDVDWSLTGKKA